MSQDSDVARVAAALRAPVIRYRNFGNGPTRAVSRPAEEPVAPAASTLDTALLAAAAMVAAAPAGPSDTVPQMRCYGSTGLIQPEVDDEASVETPAPVASVEPGPAAPPADTVIASAAMAEPVPPQAAELPPVLATPAAPAPVAVATAPPARPSVLPPAAEPVASPPLSEARAAAPAPVAAAEPPPAAPPPVIPGVAGRQTAETLLSMLRGSAQRDGAPAVAEPPPRSLLEQLRAGSVVNAPPSEGLLALLTQPAVWDLPLAGPAPAGLQPLVGQLIRPLDPSRVSLLDMPAPGFGQPLPAPAGAPEPAAVSPEPEAAAPEAAPPQHAAPQAPPRPVWAAPDASGPEPAPPPPPPPDLPEDPAQASLATMFRLVSAPPPAAPPVPARTDSLQDVLRGLRSGQRG